MFLELYYNVLFIQNDCHPKITLYAQVYCRDQVFLRKS